MWIATLRDAPFDPPVLHDKYYLYFNRMKMEFQTLFISKRDSVPKSVRQILLFFEFLLVYCAAVSWAIHVPLIVGRFGLKMMRYDNGDDNDNNNDNSDDDGSTDNDNDSDSTDNDDDGDSTDNDDDDSDSDININDGDEGR